MPSTQETQESEDIADANIADKITQEMRDANVDIHTLTTQSEMKRKYLDKIPKNISARLVGWLDENIDGKDNPRLYGKRLLALQGWRL